jgi:glycosyltransferase involved in cell wall biosynthesis
VETVVVIPTYNEAGNIERLLPLVREALPAARILVLDDGSPDGTADLVEKVAAELEGPEVTVVRRDGKRGLGAAYRDGYLRALADGAEVVVQMDADLSHDPTYLPALVAAVQHGADAAIGSRYVPGGDVENWPRTRQWLSRWGNRYAAGMLGLAINDATSGYRAYGAPILERMDVASINAEGYGFQVEMTHRLVRRGGRVVEIPILFRDRTEGDSKLSKNIISEAFGLVNKLALLDVIDGARRRRQARRRKREA